MRGPHGKRRLGTGASDHRPLLAAGAVVLLAVTLISAATPPEAQAASVLGIDINPLNWPGEILGGIGGDIAKVAVGAFDAIIKALFAPIAKFVTTQLIGWLVAVPNFTQGNVSQLERTVVAMGGGLLGAVATISIARYWVAGFAGGSDSGFAALEGLTRTVGAALFLAAWPWLFDTAVHLTNLFTSSLMGSGNVVNNTARLLAAGLGAGIALNFTPIGLFLNIAIAVAASLLFLGLLLLKIVVSVSTILVFIGMPLAAVLWPVMPWVARLAMRAFATCIAVPVLWALCFAASAAVSLNALSFNSRGFMNTLLAPLVAIVLLWVMLRLPITLARIAMLGGAALSGGFVSRAASYAAGSQMRDTARQHLPSWAGGHATQADTRATQTDSRTAGRLRNAATLAGAVASGGAGAAAGAASVGAANGGTATTASAGAANGRAYTPPPSAQAHASGHGSQSGLQTPSFAGRERDFANENFEAQFRERTNPVSAEQARAAVQSLPEGTQRGVGQLVAEHGAGAREHLAYQAMGEWSPQERDALRTLAAAGDDVRSQAVNDVLDASGTGSTLHAVGEREVELGAPPAAQPPAGGGGTDVGDGARGGTPTPADPGVVAQQRPRERGAVGSASSPRDQQPEPAPGAEPGSEGANGAGSQPQREPPPDPSTLFPDG
jgi:hypothetical protein